MKAAKPNTSGLSGVNVFCRLCGVAVALSENGSPIAHKCAPELEAARTPCGPSPRGCASYTLDLDVSLDDGLERAKRFFAEWPAGARVTTDHEIIYVCEDVDGRLPAGSLGTIVRRAMAGLYVVRWDVMPEHELTTSADCLIAPPEALS